MALCRDLLEGLVWTLGRLSPKPAKSLEKVESIFVLRNNDLGDLIAVTPLLQALKEGFPKAQLAVGLGAWSREILGNNPFVDELISINAPWHNKFTGRHSFWTAMRYILLSKELRDLAHGRFDLGIDVLGSGYGSLLLLRAGIPWRLGVRGYAGGHTAVHRALNFSSHRHVGDSALEFARLLGTENLPNRRPQLFLDSGESEFGRERWGSMGEGKRIVVAPGGGFSEKCWSLRNFIELTHRIVMEDGKAILVLGGKEDRKAGERLAELSPNVVSLAGETSLRESFAIVERADLLICNSSVLMHVAAAFDIRAIVLLGSHFNSASEHDRQWGAPKTTILGPENSVGRRDIATPGEAFRQFQTCVYVS